jgi:hypothetical protein
MKNYLKNIFNFKDKEIYIVFIINAYYVRWEMFSNNSTISSLYYRLKNKYNIIECSLIVNKKKINTLDNSIKICELFKNKRDVGVDVHVSTNNNIKIINY